MATNLIVTARARRHLAKARDRCERDRPGRGVKFLAHADKCFTGIRRVRGAGRPFHGPYRQKPVPRFPYIVVFRYEPSIDTAIVVAVFHTSRDPDDLLRRLP
jgi:plasmid stabilization system protein ParE